MRKEDRFHGSDWNDNYGKEIKAVLQKEFPLPEEVEMAKQSAFQKIKACESQQAPESGGWNTTSDEEEQNRNQQSEYGEGKICSVEQRRKAANRRKWSVYYHSLAGAAAVAAVFSTVCVANPALAARIPLVGHVFEELGQSLGFSGDFERYAAPLTGEDTVAVEKKAESEDDADDGAVQVVSGETEGTDSAYSMTRNGMTVTLSELYCNDMALYISMVIGTEDAFPATETFRDTDTVLLDILNSTLKFDYNDQEMISGACLEGKMVDDHTYAGVLRYDLSLSADTTDYDAFYEARNAFFLEQGITEEELETNFGEAIKSVCEKNGISWEEFNNETLREMGGPDFEEYRSSVEIPEAFTVELNIPEIIGTKPDGQNPEMPEDLRAEYEAAMAENGLGLTDEDYAGFTEEQKEIERRLFTDMWNAYYERYPETQENKSPYENWWVEGPWTFTLNVTRSDEGTIVKEIYDVDENDVGLETVTKTPFELVVEDSGNVDCFTVVLDADGEILDSGVVGGSSNTLAIGDHDVSKVDIFICDYTEYMDELKGYYWSDTYEEDKKTKIFKELLEEHALYHREITFE